MMSLHCDFKFTLFYYNYTNYKTFLNSWLLSKSINPKHKNIIYNLVISFTISETVCGPLLLSILFTVIPVIIFFGPFVSDKSYCLCECWHVYYQSLKKKKVENSSSAYWWGRKVRTRTHVPMYPRTSGVEVMNFRPTPRAPACRSLYRNDAPRTNWGFALLFYRGGTFFTRRQRAAFAVSQLICKSRIVS